MVKRFMFVMVMVALVVALLGSCAKPAPPSAAEMKTIKYGVVCPQSGPIAADGVGVLRGAEIAATNINKNGTTGKGPGILVGSQRYKIEVVSYDDGMDPAKSVAGYRQLTEMYGVKLIQGPLGTPGTLAVLKINEQLGVLCNPMSGSDQTRKMGNKLYIQERLPVLYYGVPLAKAAIARGYKKVCVVSDVAESWVALGKAFEAKFKELGGEVPGFEIVDQKTTTAYQSLMTNFKGKNPDAIFVILYDEPGALAVAHAFEVGYKGKFIFTTQLGPRTEERIGLDKLEGSLMQQMEWNLYRKNPELDKRGVVTRVIKQYQETYGGLVPITITVPHDIMYEFARAMEIAGTVTDPYAIRAACPKALQEGKMQLLFPIKDVLANGLNYGAYDMLCEIKGGKYVVIEPLIVPRELLE